MRVPAKVNLSLAVGPPGEDGYHELVNVFQAVSVFDEVAAAPAAGVTVAVRSAQAGPAWGADAGTGPAGVPVGEDNLAVRAARLLAQRAGVARGVALTIRKSIPVAGGMAGGSADAAAALVACDALWGTGTSHEDLLDLAAQLGADVAFPLVGGTAVGLGRGERLTPVPVGASFHWVFAPAHGGLSTADVYAECDRLRAARGEWAGRPRTPEPVLAAVRAADPEALGIHLRNDLQPATLSLRPGLARTLEAGLAGGALSALVSGSGPTCAFLARSERHAADLSAALAGSGACAGTLQGYGPVPGARLVEADTSSPAPGGP